LCRGGSAMRSGARITPRPPPIFRPSPTTTSPGASSTSRCDTASSLRRADDPLATWLAHLSENCDDPRVDATITRRRMLLSAAAGAAALAARRSGAVVPQDGRRGMRLDAGAPLACREFDLADVTLLPGPFRDNMTRDLEYLASFECDRLLAPFERVAGLPTRAPSLG